MESITNFFNRIQVLILSAFIMLVGGMFPLWLLGAWSLNEMADEVSSRIDVLYEGADLGLRLQAAILDQIALGERYMLSRERSVAEAFQRIGLEAHRLQSMYTKLPGLASNEQMQLARIEDLHSQLEVRYALAHALSDLNRERQAVAMLSETGVALDQLR